MAIAKHPLLILKAPDGEVVALPNRVLDSFVVKDKPAQASLRPLMENPQPTGWRLLGEATGDYTEPPGSSPGIGSRAGDITGHTPHYLGITGIHSGATAP